MHDEGRGDQPPSGGHSTASTPFDPKSTSQTVVNRTHTKSGAAGSAPESSGEHHDSYQYQGRSSRRNNSKSAIAVFCALTTSPQSFFSGRKGDSDKAGGRSSRGCCSNACRCFCSLFTAAGNLMCHRLEHSILPYYRRTPKHVILILFLCLLIITLACSVLIGVLVYNVIDMVSYPSVDRIKFHVLHPLTFNYTNFKNVLPFYYYFFPAVPDASMIYSAFDRRGMRNSVSDFDGPLDDHMISVMNRLPLAVAVERLQDVRFIHEELQVLLRALESLDEALPATEDGTTASGLERLVEVLQSEESVAAALGKTAKPGGTGKEAGAQRTVRPREVDGLDVLDARRHRERDRLIATQDAIAALTTPSAAFGATYETSPQVRMTSRILGSGLWGGTRFGVSRAVSSWDGTFYPLSRFTTQWAEVMAGRGGSAGEGRFMLGEHFGAGETEPRPSPKSPLHADRNLAEVLMTDSVASGVGAAHGGATSRMPSPHFPNSSSMDDADVRSQTAEVLRRSKRQLHSWATWASHLSKQRPKMESSATIFISFASFRDVECGPSLDHLVQRATHASRVYIGIAQQHNRDADVNCVTPYLLSQQCDPSGRGSFCFTDNVRVRYVEPRDAMGPTFGRYMAMLLYRGEDFYFMLDSHMRFINAWDVTVISFLLETKSPKTILSHYPEAYIESPNFNFERRTTAHLCRANFLDNFGYLRLNAIITNAKPNSLELPQPWAAGGFLFSSGSLLRDVPFDPFLFYIFDGEEILYSVRAWTHGYDIYSPRQNIVYHFYGRPRAPKVWGEVPQWYATQDKTRSRVRFLLNSRFKNTDTLMVDANTTNPRVITDVQRFGMGTSRTLDDWYVYSGASPRNYTIQKIWCY